MPASVVRERSNDIARICDLMCLVVMVVVGRDPGESEARVDLELGEDAAQVTRDCVWGHEQLLGDLAVGGALGHKACDGELGVGHRLPAGLGALARDDAPADAVLAESASHAARVPGRTSLCVQNQRPVERLNRGVDSASAGAGDTEVFECVAAHDRSRPDREQVDGAL